MNQEAIARHGVPARHVLELVEALRRALRSLGVAQPETTPSGAESR